MLSIEKTIRESGDSCLDITPYLRSVLCLTQVFSRYNRLHARQLVGVLPLSAAADLAEKVGLSEEDLYQHEGKPCLLLPTYIARMTAGDDGSNGNGDGQVVRVTEKRNLGTKDYPIRERVAIHESVVSAGHFIREQYLPMPAVRASQLREITSHARSYQLEQEMKANPAAAARRIAEEAVARALQGAKV